MRGQRKPWTPEDDAALTAMWKAGDTGVSIGLALGGRGEEAIRDRAMRHLGLPRRRNRHPSGFLDGLPKSPRRPAPKLRSPRKAVRFFAVPFDPVRFVDKKHDQCAFIEGDACGAETLCCGRPVVLGRSWCEGHLAICTIPPEKSKLVRFG